MSQYYSMVHKNLRLELDAIDYHDGLRRRRQTQQHESHQPTLNSNCPTCRAAYWMEKLKKFDEESNIEDKPRPSIGLVNVIKTETQSSAGSNANQEEHKN